MENNILFQAFNNLRSLGMMKLNRKQINEKLLILVMMLLIFVGLRMGLTHRTIHNAYGVKAYSIPITSNSESTANETLVIDEWKREIVVDAWGGISGSDYYSIFNNLSNIVYQVTFDLPANASEFSVQDAYGDYSKTSILTSFQKDYTQIKIILREPLKPKERNEFLITYKLPSSRYIITRSWQDYTLSLAIVKHEDWFVKKFSLIISLPEGAKLMSFSDIHCKVEREGLSTKIILTKHDLTDFQTSYLFVEYQYFILWGVFRPLIWTSVVALIGAAFFFIKRRLRPVTVVTPVLPNLLKKFVQAYEEKRSLSMDIESLQRRFRNGKISRKRLKRRRESLEQRLAVLNKRLMELKSQIIATAEQYEEILKEIETAEAEIETLNTDIEHVEARFRRGEISAEARRRLIDEYSRIKKRAENRISEILLRLQEESM